MTCIVDVSRFDQLSFKENFIVISLTTGSSLFSSPTLLKFAFKILHKAIFTKILLTIMLLQCQVFL